MHRHSRVLKWDLTLVWASYSSCVLGACAAPKCNLQRTRAYKQELVPTARLGSPGERARADLQRSKSQLMNVCEKVHAACLTVNRRSLMRPEPRFECKFVLRFFNLEVFIN